MAIFSAPGLDHDALRYILGQVREAQNQLDSSLAQIKNLPDSADRADRIKLYNKLKRELDRTYKQLLVDTRKWSLSEVRAVYRLGHMTAAVQMNTSAEFTVIHRHAVDAVANDVFDDVATGLQQVPEKFNDLVNGLRDLEELNHTKRDLIRVGARGAVAQQLLTGERSPAEAARQLRKELLDRGVKIIDRSGKEWNPEAYTRMLMRTKTAQAYNVGSINKMREDGITRVQVYDGSYDAACARANGQVWTIGYAYDHLVSHPNCTRAFSAVFGRGLVNRITPEEATIHLATTAARQLAVQLLVREIRKFDIPLSWKIGSTSAIPDEYLAEFEPTVTLLDSDVERIERSVDLLVSERSSRVLAEVEDVKDPAARQARNWLSKDVQAALTAGSFIRGIRFARQIPRLATDAVTEADLDNFALDVKNLLQALQSKVPTRREAQFISSRLSDLQALIEKSALSNDAKNRFTTLFDDAIEVLESFAVGGDPKLETLADLYLPLLHSVRLSDDPKFTADLTKFLDSLFMDFADNTIELNYNTAFERLVRELNLSRVERSGANQQFAFSQDGKFFIKRFGQVNALAPDQIPPQHAWFHLFGSRIGVDVDEARYLFPFPGGPDRGFVILPARDPEIWKTGPSQANWDNVSRSQSRKHTLLGILSQNNDGHAWNFMYAIDEDGAVRLAAIDPEITWNMGGEDLVIKHGPFNGGNMYYAEWVKRVELEWQNLIDGNFDELPVRDPRIPPIKISKKKIVDAIENTIKLDTPEPLLPVLTSKSTFSTYRKPSWMGDLHKWMKDDDAYLLPGRIGAIRVDGSSFRVPTIYLDDQEAQFLKGILRGQDQTLIASYIESFNFLSDDDLFDYASPLWRHRWKDHLTGKYVTRTELLGAVAELQVTRTTKYFQDLVLGGVVSFTRGTSQWANFATRRLVRLGQDVELPLKSGETVRGRVNQLILLPSPGVDERYVQLITGIDDGTELTLRLVKESDVVPLHILGVKQAKDMLKSFSVKDVLKKNGKPFVVNVPLRNEFGMVVAYDEAAIAVTRTQYLLDTKSVPRKFLDDLVDRAEEVVLETLNEFDESLRPQRVVFYRENSLIKGFYVGDDFTDPNDIRLAREEFRIPDLRPGDMAINVQAMLDNNRHIGGDPHLYDEYLRLLRYASGTEEDAFEAVLSLVDFEEWKSIVRHEVGHVVADVRRQSVRSSVGERLLASYKRRGVDVEQMLELLQGPLPPEDVLRLRDEIAQRIDDHMEADDLRFEQSVARFFKHELRLGDPWDYISESRLSAVPDDLQYPAVAYSEADPNFAEELFAQVFRAVAEGRDIPASLPDKIVNYIRTIDPPPILKDKAALEAWANGAILRGKPRRTRPLFSRDFPQELYNDWLSYDGELRSDDALKQLLSKEYHFTTPAGAVRVFPFELDVKKAFGYVSYQLDDASLTGDGIPLWDATFIYPGENRIYLSFSFAYEAIVDWDEVTERAVVEFIENFRAWSTVAGFESVDISMGAIRLSDAASFSAIRTLRLSGATETQLSTALIDEALDAIKDLGNEPDTWLFQGITQRMPENTVLGSLFQSDLARSTVRADDYFFAKSPKGGSFEGDSAIFRLAEPEQNLLMSLLQNDKKDALDVQLMQIGILPRYRFHVVNIQERLQKLIDDSFVPGGPNEESFEHLGLAVDAIIRQWNQRVQRHVRDVNDFVRVRDYQRDIITLLSLARRTSSDEVVEQFTRRFLGDRVNLDTVIEYLDETIISENAYTEGILTLTEFEERVTSIWADLIRSSSMRRGDGALPFRQLANDIVDSFQEDVFRRRWMSGILDDSALEPSNAVERFRAIIDYKTRESTSDFLFNFATSLRDDVSAVNYLEEDLRSVMFLWENDTPKLSSIFSPQGLDATGFKTYQAWMDHINSTDFGWEFTEAFVDTQWPHKIRLVSYKDPTAFGALPNRYEYFLQKLEHPEHFIARVVNPTDVRRLAIYTSGENQAFELLNDDFHVIMPNAFNGLANPVYMRLPKSVYDSGFDQGLLSTARNATPDINKFSLKYDAALTSEQKQALSSYKASGYRTMNSAARARNIEGTRPGTIKKIHALDDALTVKPDADVLTAYGVQKATRSLIFRATDTTIQKSVVARTGMEIVEPGFVSSTWNPGFAQGWNQGWWLFDYSDTPHVGRVIDVGGENEVLIPRGMVYRVLGEVRMAFYELQPGMLKDVVEHGLMAQSTEFINDVRRAAANNTASWVVVKAVRQLSPTEMQAIDILPRGRGIAPQDLFSVQVGSSIRVTQTLPDGVQGFVAEGRLINQGEGWISLDPGGGAGVRKLFWSTFEGVPNIKVLQAVPTAEDSLPSRIWLRQHRPFGKKLEMPFELEDFLSSPHAKNLAVPDFLPTLDEIKQGATDIANAADKFSYNELQQFHNDLVSFANFAGGGSPGPEYARLLNDVAKWIDEAIHFANEAELINNAQIINLADLLSVKDKIKHLKKVPYFIYDVTTSVGGQTYTWSVKKPFLVTGQVASDLGINPKVLEWFSEAETWGLVDNALGFNPGGLYLEIELTHDITLFNGVTLFYKQQSDKKVWIHLSQLNAAGFRPEQFTLAVKSFNKAETVGVHNLIQLQELLDSISADGSIFISYKLSGSSKVKHGIFAGLEESDGFYWGAGGDVFYDNSDAEILSWHLMPKLKSNTWYQSMTFNGETYTNVYVATVIEPGNGSMKVLLSTGAGNLQEVDLYFITDYSVLIDPPITQLGSKGLGFLDLEVGKVYDVVLGGNWNFESKVVFKGAADDDDVLKFAILDENGAVASLPIHVGWDEIHGIKVANKANTPLTVAAKKENSAPIDVPHDLSVFSGDYIKTFGQSDAANLLQEGVTYRVTTNTGINSEYLEYSESPEPGVFAFFSAKGDEIYLKAENLVSVKLAPPLFVEDFPPIEIIDFLDNNIGKLNVMADLIIAAGVHFPKPLLAPVNFENLKTLLYEDGWKFSDASLFVDLMKKVLENVSLNTEFGVTAAQYHWLRTMLYVLVSPKSDTGWHETKHIYTYGQGKFLFKKISELQSSIKTKAFWFNDSLIDGEILLDIAGDAYKNFTDSIVGKVPDILSVLQRFWAWAAHTGAKYELHTEFPFDEILHDLAYHGIVGDVDPDISDYISGQITHWASYIFAVTGKTPKTLAEVLEYAVAAHTPPKIIKK